VAGAAFFVSEQGQNIIRLSFSAPSHEKIREGIKRLAAAVHEEMAALVK
jgi:DNA-binding transcriptional MocR family regulator